MHTHHVGGTTLRDMHWYMHMFPEIQLQEQSST